MLQKLFERPSVSVSEDKQKDSSKASLSSR